MKKFLRVFSVAMMAVAISVAAPADAHADFFKKLKKALNPFSPAPVKVMDTADLLKDDKAKDLIKGKMDIIKDRHETKLDHAK